MKELNWVHACLKDLGIDEIKVSVDAVDFGTTGWGVRDLEKAIAAIPKSRRDVLWSSVEGDRA